MATITVTDVPDDLKIIGDKINIDNFISKYSKYLEKNRNNFINNNVKIEYWDENEINRIGLTSSITTKSF